MKRDQVYRGWCYNCKSYLVWQEPSGRQVDKLLCDRCGTLVDAVKGSNLALKGEVQCLSRVFVERKTGRTRP